MLRPNNPKRRNPAHRESQEAKAFITWFDAQHPNLQKCLFHCPNGVALGGSSAKKKAAGARWKAEGVRAGVSDYIMLIPKGIYHGLCLELKATGRTKCSISKEQGKFLDLASRNGYLAVAALGWEAAQVAISDYLGRGEVREDSKIIRF